MIVKNCWNNSGPNKQKLKPPTRKIRPESTRFQHFKSVRSLSCFFSVSIYSELIWIGAGTCVFALDSLYPPKKTRFKPICGRRHLSPRRRLSNTCRIWCADGPDSRAECVSRIMCNGRMGIATQPAVNGSNLVLFGWVTLCKCGYFTGCFKSTPSFEFGVPPPPPEFVLHMTSWEFWPIRYCFFLENLDVEWWNPKKSNRIGTAEKNGTP